MILKRMMAGGFLTGALMLGSATPVFAQTTVPEAVEDVVDNDDDGSDKTGLWGLLGLLGLAGLAGLKRPKRNVESTTYKVSDGPGSSAAR
jgi:MYXO-CTERM domain-containing protein